MADQTNYTLEDVAKKLIIDYLNVYRSTVVGQNTTEDFLTLINGGVIRGQSTIGFLELKRQILLLMDVPNDNNSVALNYIQNTTNNL